jgi:hypothetical protein
MAQPVQHIGSEAGTSDTLGAKDNNVQDNSNGMVLPRKRVTINVPDQEEPQLPRPGLQRAITDLFSRSRKLEIYISKNGIPRDVINAKITIDGGHQAHCQISRAFLVKHGFQWLPADTNNTANIQTQPESIQLKWSLKKYSWEPNSYPTSFLIRDLQGIDCVLTQVEFDTKGRKRTSWKIFGKISHPVHKIKLTLWKLTIHLRSSRLKEGCRVEANLSTGGTNIILSDK